MLAKEVKAFIYTFILPLTDNTDQDCTAAMIGIVELVNLYLRSLSRPQNLVLYQIFDLQLRWLRKFPRTRTYIQLPSVQTGIT